MKHNLRDSEVLIIKNNTGEGPGLIEDFIRDYGIKYTIVDFSKEQKALNIDNCGAVIILGGPDSANDKNRKMELELALIKRILEAGIPFLGICLGMQTFVKAAGGRVVKSQVKETGFRDPEGDFLEVELTEEGKGDPLFAGLDESFGVFHLHGETVTLPGEMKLLASGKFCLNQIVKYGSNAYGMQCHLELTREMFEDWINEDPDLLKLDRDQLVSDFEATNEKYKQTAFQLFQNFLRIAEFI